MRPKDLLLPAVIAVVIVGAIAVLLLRGSDDDSSRTQVQGGASSSSSSGSASAAPTQAPAVAAPTQPPAPPVTQAGTPATAPAPPAPSSGEPSCTGPTLASLKRPGPKTFSAAPQRVIDPAKTYTALIKTNKGDITVSLAAKDAPITVNNFVFLACQGFYDGLTWHRVVRGFVIQGGDPQGNGTGGPGYRFNNEISPNLKHELGSLAMANAGPNTNGSQFYITLAPQPSLDGSYNVFGKVTDGMPVVQRIVVGDKIESVSVRES